MLKRRWPDYSPAGVVLLERSLTEASARRTMLDKARFQVDVKHALPMMA
jgi:hypothetical protein